MISVFELHNAVKAAVIPVQAWRGLESSRNLSLEDSKQSAYEGGKVVSLRPRQHSWYSFMLEPETTQGP